MWVVLLKSSSSEEFETKKIFFNFVVFEELSRIEVFCEHVIVDMILFAFSVIFLHIKTFFLKILIQNYISRHKKNELWNPNRRKAIQRLVLVS